ncbi:biotin-dependent carboxyltransferase family protein [Chitinophaga qingshengii]|uniref:Biotin-dependent carboxyltransferase family protein n=1 Tax=Chitinophaga qingshengii TaxID=1569794 RepID=A0ABR7TIE3_9BACT|nr:biotin-dependent carboxyltransferase family protein [Chitinophaga qingshengii]MBC9929760.1 biotin-dependent carboxyltransferase family protein [Chitinophaga qingshengii]
MSIVVLHQGLLDTIQDKGRYGFQHLGINPGGVMDRIAMSVANALTGNPADEALLELHFPAGKYLFETPALIALSGADFSAAVNGEALPLHQPRYVPAGAILTFNKLATGARCYLAVRHGFSLTPWLGSYSTHLKAAQGGFEGRALRKGDKLAVRLPLPPTGKAQTDLFPWKAATGHLYNKQDTIRILPGICWDMLDDSSQQQLLTGSFRVSQHSDRMGFRLSGTSLHTRSKVEQLSSGICKGAIQLLPDGQLIILMADHQTTGGYPVVAHVITADMPALAQYQPGQILQFSTIGQEAAEEMLFQQERAIRYLQHACQLRLEKWLPPYELY